MEERIKLLEKQVACLTDMVLLLNEENREYGDIIDRLIKMQKRSINIENDLFTYCKELRRKIEA